MDINNNIKISDNVFQAVAARCAMDIPGVASLSGSIYKNLLKWGGQQEYAGVQVHNQTDEEGRENEDVKIIDVHLIVEKDHPIPNIASNLQQAIKETIEAMTSVEVAEVNIFVEDILSRLEKPVEEKEPSQPRDYAEVNKKEKKS
jgi:uncharacterized alkaline shock family protein YloU